MHVSANTSVFSFQSSFLILDTNFVLICFCTLAVCIEYPVVRPLRINLTMWVLSRGPYRHRFFYFARRRPDRTFPVYDQELLFPRRVRGRVRAGHGRHRLPYGVGWHGGGGSAGGWGWCRSRDDPCWVRNRQRWWWTGIRRYGLWCMDCGV